MRIDLRVIGGVVFVIAGGLKNRRQVKRVGTEALDVVKFFDNAGQITAEKIVVVHLV